MSRPRIEALLVAVLAACGGSTENAASTSSSSGSSGGSSGASSSGSSGTSSSGAPTFGCDASSQERTETYALATACETYEARKRAATDAGAEAGSDGGDDGGADAGTFDCAALSCVDLCQVVGGNQFGGVWNGGPDMCTKTATELSCTVFHPCGRRFASMEEPSTNDVLRDAAYLEAASIIAFEHLARDLSFHEAPFHLIAAAVRAGDDERRHTALVHALGGGEWPAPKAPEWKPRALLDIAIENAVEGCVGETWGALVALAQARDARSPEVRAAYASIAPDEIDHATLAYEIDAWLRPLLTTEERAAVDEAKAAAWSRFEIDIDADVARALGIPNGDTSRRMLASLASAA